MQSGISYSTCIPDGHLEWVTIPDAVLIHLTSWWWARVCSKHIEDWNKRIIQKNCASSWSPTRKKKIMFVCLYIYTGCNRRNGPDFGRVFLMLNYTEKPQKTYTQSWKFSEIMASEIWNFDSCYWLPNSYWNWQEYVVSVMLISVHDIKVTYEWHKAIK